MDVEQSVAQHYTHGSLEQAVLAGLAAAGKDLNALTLDDLAPVDEFHIGGRQATVEFAEALGARPGMYLLDVGSGLGGPSRYFAAARGCRVTGIDLTEEYVQVARALATRLGLSDRVSYRQGSAVALPFEPGVFDGAYMLHVGMNIQDKRALFEGLRRVIRPGGVIGIYDVMREEAGDLAFPVPWASSPATSFVETAATYRSLMEAAGFVVETVRSRRDFALEFFQRRAQATQSGGPPPVGIHIAMGESAPQKSRNMAENVRKGLMAPTEIIGLVG
jgi:ubiquinone/menaquinone biosynthesis C-methylase UbiE